MTREQANGLLGQLSTFFGEPVLPLSTYRSALERLAAGTTDEVTAGGHVLADNVLVGDLRVDAGAREAWVGARQLHLKPREFDVLFILARNANIVMRRDLLIELAWGGIDFDGNVRTVDTHIRRLRQALGETASVSIRTRHGIGYQLCVEQRPALRAVA